MSRLFEVSAEKTLSYMRQANETFAEMQSNLGQAIEQQVQEVSAQLQTGLEESSKIAEEGLEEGKRMSKATADESRDRNVARATLGEGLSVSAFRCMCPYSLDPSPRFRKPPYHPGQSVFPSPVAVMACPLIAFPTCQTLKRSLTFTPDSRGLL